MADRDSLHKRLLGGEPLSPKDLRALTGDPSIPNFRRADQIKQQLASMQQVMDLELKQNGPNEIVKVLAEKIAVLSSELNALEERKAAVQAALQQGNFEPGEVMWCLESTGQWVQLRPERRPSAVNFAPSPWEGEDIPVPPPPPEPPKPRAPAYDPANPAPRKYDLSGE